MVDITPPNLDSPVGRVRKYIPDLVQLENPKTPEAAPAYYFSDIDIAGYLSEYTSVGSDVGRAQVKRAAADAIDAMANNEAMILKKIKTEDLETDGPALANSLRGGAKALREQAAQEDEATNAIFALVPFRHQHRQTRLPRRFR